MTAHDLSLTALNERLHGDLEDLLLGVLEALTEVDLPRARAGWAALDAALEHHKSVEDTLVIPRYEATGGPFDRGSAPSLYDHDHRAIEKVRDAWVDVLAALPAERRAVVLALPTLYRLRGVLEHHSEREQRFLYPTLDAALDADERGALARALTGQSTISSASS